MSSSSRRWALVLAFALTACTLPDVPRNADDSPFTPPTVTEREMLAQVNAARTASQDCGIKGTFKKAAALQLEPHLSAAAQSHAADMKAEGYFSHTAPDGSTIGTRVTRSGYRWSKVGENIARGYKSVDDVMNGWLESDGHCANLMNPGYTELGVGKSGNYWVQVFARAK